MRRYLLALVCAFFTCNTGQTKPYIAVILNTTRCSRARHTLATPNGVFQMWLHDKQANQNINKFITSRCNATLDQYVAIDYHYLTRTFYMTNIGQRMIEAYDIRDAGSSPRYRKRPVFKGISRKTTGIAVDWIHNNIYWADPAYDAIFMTASDGRGQLFQYATIVVGGNLDTPSGLAVQPYIGRIFWSDVYRLESALLDGSNRTLLRSDLVRPKGMCIDYSTNRLYWIEQDVSESVIRSTDMTGANQRVEVQRPASELFDLDIDGDWIVTTDQKRGVIAIYDVKGHRSQEKAWGGKPFGIVIDGKTVSGEVVPQHNSKSPSDRGVILLATPSGIYRINRNFADVKDEENLVHLPLHPQMTVYAMTANAHTDYIYYYEEARKEGRIMRVKMNLRHGKSEGQFTPEPLTNAAVKEVSDLSIDWLTRNLYWSDKGTRQIVVAREDGRFPAVVVEGHLKSPRTVVVDPISMFIFWGDKLNIGRSGLDGTEVEYSLFRVNHDNHRIAVDPKTDRIYFSDTVLLCYGDYHGHGKYCSSLLNSKVLINSLAIMNDYIIWSSISGGVFAQDKDTFDDVGQSSSHKSFHGITIYHTSSQPLETNNCTRNNGGCEQLCLPNLTNQGRSCKCTVGFWDQQDGSCVKAQLMEPYLVFPDERLKNIYQGSLILNMYGMFPLQSLSKVKDVAVNAFEKKIYWTDYLGVINCAYFNGSHQHVVFADKTVKPVNIALDVASKLVYFVDNRGNIGVVYVVTGAYQELLGRDVIKANDIALSPEQGLMFISGQTEVHNGSTNVTERLQCITMSHMDGTNLEQVAFGLGKPGGITVYKDRVIWADEKYKTLEEVRVGSWNRTVLVENMRHAPVDLVAHRDYLYWTETGGRYVMRVPLTDPIIREMYEPSWRFFNLGGLDVVSDEFNYTSVCQRQHCQDTRFRQHAQALSTHAICIPTPRGAVCDSNPGERFDSAACHFGRRACNDREKYMEMSKNSLLCRITQDSTTFFS
ncbi:low-density lipoprotein receptor-related protein 6-like [Haliotis asinina]|uniref:low-density lipoprotein receptor-related protein 6-like n=1 Tax=Haliotis asinina TaxID=109174 RepID=UPI0035324660